MNFLLDHNLCFYVAFLHHDVLQSYLPYLKQQLKTEPVLNFLAEERLISQNDVSVVKAKTAGAEQCEELIRLVQCGNKTLYDGLLDALDSTKQIDIQKTLGVITKRVYSKACRPHM